MAPQLFLQHLGPGDGHALRPSEVASSLAIWADSVDRQATWTCELGRTRATASGQEDMSLEPEHRELRKDEATEIQPGRAWPTSLGAGDCLGDPVCYVLWIIQAFFKSR